MKDKLLFMLGLGACAMPGGWTEAYGQVQKQTQERPNVLFIIMDDMCDWANYLGGNNQVKTPNLDRLAARGVYFSNAYAAVPLSNPSRTAMMTGLQPFVTGIYNNNQQLQDSPQVQARPRAVLDTKKKLPLRSKAVPAETVCPPFSA